MTWEGASVVLRWSSKRTGSAPVGMRRHEERRLQAPSDLVESGVGRSREWRADKESKDVETWWRGEAAGFQIGVENLVCGLGPQGCSETVGVENRGRKNREGHQDEAGRRWYWWARGVLVSGYITTVAATELGGDLDEGKRSQAGPLGKWRWPQRGLSRKSKLEAQANSRSVQAPSVQAPSVQRNNSGQGDEFLCHIPISGSFKIPQMHENTQRSVQRR